MKKLIILEVVIGIAIIIGLGVYLSIDSKEEKIAPTTVTVKHCDNDSRLCPDGSAVLREGEQCEFAACPSMFGQIRDWQNRKDQTSNISFKYPETLGSKYVIARDWPPAVRVVGKTFSCPLSNTVGSTTKEVQLNGATYCIGQQNEGAAGSTYEQYLVTTKKQDTYITFSFTVQLPQCMNYDGGEQSACTAAQNAFDVVELVDRIAATVSL